MNGYKGEFSYEALKASNPQYADFRAFKEKKVIYCNLEWIPLYENLPLSPDVLLSDMIKLSPGTTSRLSSCVLFASGKE